MKPLYIAISALLLTALVVTLWPKNHEHTDTYFDLRSGRLKKVVIKRNAIVSENILETPLSRLLESGSNTQAEWRLAYAGSDSMSTNTKIGNSLSKLRDLEWRWQHDNTGEEQKRLEALQFLERVRDEDGASNHEKGRE
jgi:hypothetical protein